MADPVCLDIPEPITPENRNAKIRELFGDDWLINYLDGKLAFERLSPQQKTLATAIDGVVVGMLDPNVPGDSLTSFDMKRILENDGWVDKREWSRLLAGSSVRSGPNQLTKLRDLEAEMSQEVVSAVDDLMAGIVSGFVDTEDDGTRYTPNEMEPFFSPRAKGLLKESFKSTILGFYDYQEPLPPAVETMEGICSTIKTKDIEQCEPDETIPLTHLMPEKSCKRAI